MVKGLPGLRSNRSSKDPAETKRAELARFSVMTHEERYGEAVRRIEDAAGNGSAELSLADLKLTAVPETLGDLTQLSRLDLGSSKLTSLPGCLRKLTNLSELELKNSDLTALPNIVARLDHPRGSSPFQQPRG